MNISRKKRRNIKRKKKLMRNVRGNRRIGNKSKRTRKGHI